MTLAVYVERMMEILESSGAPGPDDAPDFRRFVEHSTHQIRASYFTRHAPREVLAHLAELWRFTQGPPPTTPQVEAHACGAAVVVMTRMLDQPFIVDTVRLSLKDLGATYVGGLNLVLALGRDQDGKVIRIGDRNDPLESVVRSLAEGLSEEHIPRIGAPVKGALLLSQGMVADFHAMTDLVDAAAYRFTRLADRLPHAADQLRETAEFLRWLLSDNFVFMTIVHDGRRLGLARETLKDHWETSHLEKWRSPDDLPFPVEVRKGRSDARVHRSGRMDEIAVLVPSDGRHPPRRLLIQGLFTYRAVTQPSRHVPLLRRVLGRILRDQDSQAGSYRYKGIANAFDSLPTEFLFTTPPVEISGMIERVLEAEQEQDIRVHLVENRDAESAFVLAALPRHQWSDSLRKRIGELLHERLGAASSDHGVFVGRFDTMLVHWHLTGVASAEDELHHELQVQISHLATPWAVQLYRALSQRVGSESADALITRYGDAFEDIYTRMAPPARAADDIAAIEALTQGQVTAEIFRDSRDRLSLRIFQDQDILLSDLLPVLDNLGLVVEDQFQDKVRPRGRAAITIDTFRLRGTEDLPLTRIEEQTTHLVDAIQAIFCGSSTDDVLNTVLLRSAIPWQAVDLLRAYVGYARQIGLRYTQSRVQELLLAQPELVGKWWALFQARFDPDLGSDRKKATASADEAYSDGVRAILNHDQDVLFSTLHNLIEATLRTNFYRTDRAFHYISIKLDHGSVRHLPQPAMMYEIYVHHVEMEGVHLRGGKIARGGIRWSDREDYRREILDLVSTQMVKNVLIVPEGAKGGFFIKRAMASRADRRAQADRLYKVLIRGLLDITDNIVDGVVVSPPRVVIHDAQDPYLVVAADKGTAHLSDTANGLSRDYAFWLDDAFASGGSNGYDHKVVGITARGAWATVDRHFREMGLDPHTETFTCMGIGDPSGDVFGNGVIQYPTMKLVAAFNHRHVFIDPDPDPESSYAERKRLFDEVKGWDHYDESLLSEGGGIFSRTAKAIQLTPQIQKLLGVLKDELPVDVVLRLLLRLNVDLLWNGGIGTYVKASTETHPDAGDPTNDTYRVNADELRCKVVGEGGNLGFTPGGRIEYALRGGRLNTDAIDNSGGVDMSDHEVNLKILLSPLIRSGELEWDDRNTLLESLTDVVAEQVLDNSDTHASQLSYDQIRSRRDPMLYSRPIDWICQRGGLTRSALKLPSDDDLQRRAAQNQGLTRPELAVLAAHVKMHVFGDLKNADTNAIVGFHDKVLGYFPERIQKDYAPLIADHMLYGSIGMTVVTSEIVGETGAMYFPLVMELTGVDAVTAAAAWYRAAELLDIRELFEQLINSKTSLAAKYRAWIDVHAAMISVVTLWLAPGESAADEREGERIRGCLQKLGRMRGTALEARLKTRATRHLTRKLPPKLAQRLAVLGELAAAREVARLPDNGGRLSHDLIRYLAIGEASRVLPAIRAIEARTSQGGWGPIATGILRTRYIMLLRNLIETVTVGPEVRLGVDRVTTRLSRGPLRELRAEVDHILGDQPTVSSLLVAEERVRAWLARQS